MTNKQIEKEFCEDIIKNINFYYSKYNTFLPPKFKIELQIILERLYQQGHQDGQDYQKYLAN